MYETIGLWVAAILTLAVFSFLYKENPLYRFAEHVVVGSSLGYTIVITYQRVLYPRLVEPVFLHGESLVLIVPAMLGLLYVTRFFPRIAWLSRYPMAFLLGMGMGMAFPYDMQAYILRQIQATLIPLYTPGAPWYNTVGAVVIVLGTLAGLIYFFFSKPHKGPFFGFGSKVGIWIIMIGFGATFGFTVMGRISLLIGRVQFLLSDWLGLLH
ncbi:MAG TPA: hypothetical protein PLX54_03555 [Candidatus Fermentibacter daniensis]|nr:hypothetical protein [Candidatus Fermentibacter daniensis]HOR07509.1 hypothetical protein [Candidatus Fermentibacter daniensis]HPK51431.1 hypothetical protein [Candidatus Fermentibacter daniensis]HQE57028.1 hypothetical protein [Candidatus Fermentibacter daniensis]HQH93381.1 hypothetical protein [Candidatus Fermentibacter daniensis]